MHIKNKTESLKLLFYALSGAFSRFPLQSFFQKRIFAAIAARVEAIK
jgi:hypothetical protein